MRINCTYSRQKTTSVRVGSLFLGSDYPIRIQTMANTSTNDVEASVAQALRCQQAGTQLLRFTTQGLREVENLRLIHQTLAQNPNYIASPFPLVADVHFQADVADAAAQVVEKVRINPGNYIDPARKFQHVEFTDDEYQTELNRLANRFSRLLDICRTHSTAIRLGVNHGSLSDRIMSRYGDTPAGMVESVMEFLRVAKKQNFNNLLVSIKSSNTRIMVQTVQLLVQTMHQEQMSYPLHLGVTEAGEGEDGRIKSAVGIGALLSQGIGDTIRVSLSEAPEKELPVSKALVEYFTNPRSKRYSDSIIVEWQDNTIRYQSAENDWQLFCLQTAAECGRWLWEKQCQSLQLVNPNFSTDNLARLQQDILQAAGIIRYKPEFVSCPGCGRTLFDLEKTIADIKTAFSSLHLSNPVPPKIAIMGCIVNGPGEMADADYGYVGAGRARVSLYKGKECVLKNIPQEEAVSQLLALVEKG